MDQVPDSTAEGLRQALSALASSDVADAGGRPFPPGLKPLGAAKLCGFARTVHLAPGDNLGLQALAVQAGPGDVLVAVGGGGGTALVGELLSLRAAVRGAAGFLVDGYARDASVLALPVFARGTMPRKPRRADFVALDEPVDLLGVTVTPGDLLLADEDGIVLVPRGEAEAILARVAAVVHTNEVQRAQIVAGEDLVWLEEALARRRSSASGSNQPPV